MGLIELHAARYHSFFGMLRRVSGARIVLVDVGAISADLARAFRARGYEVNEVALREVGSWLAAPALVVLGPGAARQASLEALSPYLSWDRPFIVLAEDSLAADRLRSVVSTPVAHVQPRGLPSPIADRVLEAVAAHALAREAAASALGTPHAPASAAPVARPAPSVGLPSATGEATTLGAPPTPATMRRAGNGLLLAGGCLFLLGLGAGLAALLLTRTGSSSNAGAPRAPSETRREAADVGAESAPTGTRPEEPEEADAGVQTASRRGVPEEALAEARRAGRESDPRASDAWVRRAGREIDAGEIARAESTLREALALDPDNPRAWAHIGRLHVSKGEPEAAIAWLELAIDRRFQRAQYHVWLGDARLAAGDRRGARLAWESALRREPENADALERLGRRR